LSSINAVEDDIGWLVVLRIAAGLAIAALAATMLADAGDLRGYLSAERHVPYCGFDWLPALAPGPLRLVAAALVALGLAMAAGYRYRVSAPLTAATAAYLFFLDSGFYQSTTYLAVLLLTLLACSPAGDAFSLDARARPRAPHDPRDARAPHDTRDTRAIRSLFQFQVGVVYFFSGLAKLNADWLSGRTLVTMHDYALARSLGDGTARHAILIAASWIGMAFDLGIVFFLLWRRTRRLAFAALLAFHLHNALTMRLGAVPWLVLVASTVYLPPDWPRRLARLLGRPYAPPTLRVTSPRKLSRASRALMFTWVVVQLLLPLRRWITPGDPYFTETGFYFTWALRSRAKTSVASLRIVDRNTGAARLQPIEVGLAPVAARRAAGDPHAIWWQAREEARGRDVSVYALAVVNVNGGPHAYLIDPSVDLAAERFPLATVPPWVRSGPR
jgi:vitamin K-dependent gamma-carboxylase